MKLDYTYQDIYSILNGSDSDISSKITSVAFDTRQIHNGESTLFFALKGRFRDGHQFIEDAYKKGVRFFVVSETCHTSGLNDCYEIVVPDTLEALQKLAAHHRDRFNCEVVAITGSNGKTIVKEWLNELLIDKYNVVRSPKSYNSTLGVPLSLLEINEDTDVALIEVGVPGMNEMEKLETIIRPTKGIFTSFGSAHRELFDSAEEHLNEKLKLFKNLHEFIFPVGAFSDPSGIGKSILPVNSNLNKDTNSEQNLALAIDMAKELGVSDESINKVVPSLKPLALRLESYEGINGNTVINDTYSLDEESLRNSLAYQKANAKGKRRIIILGFGENAPNKENFRSVVDEFDPDDFIIYNPNSFDINAVKNASVLIKGSRDAGMEKLANQFKLYQHQTYIEFDLKAIRHNINIYKSAIDIHTKLLCMVKASSYGADAETMARFLEDIGVDYLGVAYPDEGVELRQAGVNLPILVMNCEESSFDTCIEYKLEPAIYSLNQLDVFVKALISRSKLHYPIHIKLETGMNRLGFTESEIPALISALKGQPEIRIKSAYSHLAESDKRDSDFTLNQIKRFNSLTSLIAQHIDYHFDRHIANSNAILNYPESHMDMVRLGIGMYGCSTVEGERPALNWTSKISQVRTITKGETVGYNRAFEAKTDAKIAVIPVGYADGFRRSLSNGVGGVFIKGNYCPTIGNVCMDMIMVELKDDTIEEGESVEIIGPHQNIQDLADKMGTIPYEVMTGLSERLPRIFTQ